MEVRKKRRKCLNKKESQGNNCCLEDSGQFVPSKSKAHDHKSGAH